VSDYSGGVDIRPSLSGAELAAEHGLSITGKRPALPAYTGQL